MPYVLNDQGIPLDNSLTCSNLWSTRDISNIILTVSMKLFTVFCMITLGIKYICTFFQYLRHNNNDLKSKIRPHLNNTLQL